MSLQPSSRILSGRAPAKVNLFLRVIARRADGYHELETVMAKLPGLFDTVSCSDSWDEQLTLSVEPCYPASFAFEPVPVDDTNLVLRAARLLRTRTGCRFGAKLHLIKRVPAAAGLGGGSSDAATMLLLLNDLWRTGLTEAELLGIGAEIGSDVPFFVANSAAALCSGRGEHVQPISWRIPLPIVLVRPMGGLSTSNVYRACIPEPQGPSAEEFVSCQQHLGLFRVARGLHNSLQRAAESLSEEIGALRQLFQANNVISHQLTGSGSAYFGICQNARHACVIANKMRGAGVPWVWSGMTAAA